MTKTLITGAATSTGMSTDSPTGTYGAVLPVQPPAAARLRRSHVPTPVVPAQISGRSPLLATAVPVGDVRTLSAAPSFSRMDDDAQVSHRDRPV